MNEQTREATTGTASIRETGTLVHEPRISPAVEAMYHPQEHPSRDARLPLSYGRPTPYEPIADSFPHDQLAHDFFTSESEGPPIRVPHIFRRAITAWASLASYGVPTTLNGERAGILVVRPIPQHATRGVRGVSGVFATTDKTASRSRIPAIFVPTAVVSGGGR